MRKNRFLGLVTLAKVTIVTLVLAISALGLTGCPPATPPPDPDITYTAPALGSAVNGVSVAGVYFGPASPQSAGTSVTAMVTFSGTATAGGVFAVNLTSAKAGLNGAAKVQTIAAGASPSAETFAFTVSAQHVDDFVLSFIAGHRADPSIKTTFGISTTGKTGVTDTFNAIHTYVSGRTATQLAAEGIIQLGDYIDLPSITVDGTTVADRELMSNHGRLLRLIVVGINSFNASGSYTVTDNGGDAHLVFQFQNVAFKHNMEATATNVDANGYLGSVMRTYLTGAFLTGLTAAGVPDSVLWAPTRYVANGGSGATAADPIQDKLWLPTEREMVGTRTYSNETYETEENQARLEYYNSDASRKKYDTSPLGTAFSYWLASPLSTAATHFCYISYATGTTAAGDASAESGCVPAFCVK
jgi:hypothetical protein